MRIERVISFFDKSSEELVGEIDVSHIELEQLVDIFNPSGDDPLMYYPYNIDITIGAKISNLQGIKFEFDKYIYQLDCFQKD